jgi:hypothetical protein
MTLGRRTGVAIVAALAGLVAVPATASADTLIMGSTLANPFDGGVSGGASTVSAQLSFDPVTSPNPVVSPVNGVITGWKVKSADDGAIYTLKVLRPNGPVSLVTMTNTSFKGIRSVQAPSAVPAGTAGTTPTGKIFSYPASLPISKGDYIGVLTGGDDDDLPQYTTNGLDRNLIGNNFSAQPANGASANLLADKQHDLLLQATIQFQPAANKPELCTVPSLKGLKLPAARDALTAAKCGATNVTRKRLKRTKKNKKRKGKVLSQSPAAGEIVPAGTPVSLKVAGLKKKKRTKRK